MTKADALTKRRVPLAGTSNFRDLGGYKTVDGRRVKWGYLFRSSSLAGLTDEDLECIAALGIKFVCDLRRDEERFEAPSRLPESKSPRVVTLPVGPNRKDSKLYEYLWRGEATEEEMRIVMQEIYRDFAIKFASQYARFMQSAVNAAHLPLLFHCSAGKDRTGFAAALILETLGVSRETIIEDYILSNRYISRNLSDRYRNLKSPELFHTMMAADPDYLLAAYEAADEAFGSFNRYLSDGLGMPCRAQDEFRRLLLE